MAAAGSLQNAVITAEGFLRQPEIVAGYAAHLLCSGVFVSHRSPAAVLHEDLTIGMPKLAGVLFGTIDWSVPNQVTVGLPRNRKTATYRPGLGCIVEQNGYPPPPPVAEPAPRRGRIAPVVSPIEPPALAGAIGWAFESRPDWRSNAVVVVQDGRLLAERYGPGFWSETPQLGWSMAKSVTNTLIGIAMKEGLIGEVSVRSLRADWCAKPGDARCGITLDHLLRMTSGLAFNEAYGGRGDDVLPMLALAGDMAGYAADKPLKTLPGDTFYYASGTSNIITGYLKSRVAATGGGDVRDYARSRLFAPLGISSGVFEPDASGTPVGSSFVYLTARDWAKLGLLYLWNGEWRGVDWDGMPKPSAPMRILPEGWVKYSTTPTVAKPADGDNIAEEYGAHIWTRIYRNLRNPGGPVQPPVPGDAFFFFGHDGQSVTIIPSRKLVVVRLGLTRIDERGKALAFNQELFLSKILAALPQ